MVKTTKERVFRDTLYYILGVRIWGKREKDTCQMYSESKNFGSNSGKREKETNLSGHVKCILGVKFLEQNSGKKRERDYFE